MENEQELIKQLKYHNHEAFSKVIKMYQKQIYNLAVSWTHSREDAQDITQQTFINAYKKIETFKEKSTFKTWLYTIALNLLKNKYRKAYTKREKHIEYMDEIEDGFSLSKQTFLNMEMEKVNSCINELRDKQRTTVMLRLYKEFSFKEIAETMKCSENSAKVNFFHGIKNLRNKLIKKGVNNALPY